MFRCVSIFLSLASLSFAQSTATISGRVSDPEGGAVAKAPVQAKNATTGAAFRQQTSASGEYVLTGVPAGKYEISVSVPCCAFLPFSKEDVSVAPSQKVQFDVRLEEGGSYRTVGDDPNGVAETMRSRAKVRPAPAPRMPDGKPNLSGMWASNDDLYPAQPDALPWADKLMKERLENHFRDSPSGQCLPSGPLVTGPQPVKIIQTSKVIVELIEDFVAARQIFLDGRGHPKDMNPSWYGNATAKWEGDTLVIDTVGFNNRGWIGLYPITEQLHLTERYHRRDLAHLDIEMTVDDPGTFRKPWKLNMIWDLVPNEEIEEFVCEDHNKDAAHLVGK